MSDDEYRGKFINGVPDFMEGMSKEQWDNYLLQVYQRQIAGYAARILYERIGSGYKVNSVRREGDTCIVDYNKGQQLVFAIKEASAHEYTHEEHIALLKEMDLLKYNRAYVAPAEEPILPPFDISDMYALPKEKLHYTGALINGVPDYMEGAPLELYYSFTSRWHEDLTTEYAEKYLFIHVGPDCAINGMRRRDKVTVFNYDDDQELLVTTEEVLKNTPDRHEKWLALLEEMDLLRYFRTSYFLHLPKKVTAPPVIVH